MRAWVVPRGATALEAAATIHADLAREFMSVEVVSFLDLSELGGELAVKREGKLTYPRNTGRTGRGYASVAGPTAGGTRSRRTAARANNVQCSLKKSYGWVFLTGLLATATARASNSNWAACHEPLPARHSQDE